MAIEEPQQLIRSFKSAPVTVVREQVETQREEAERPVCISLRVEDFNGCICWVDQDRRRMLNQASFKHIYIVNEEVTGDDLNTPMRELLATQRGWSAFETTEDLAYAHDLAHAEAKLHEGATTTKRATVSNGPLDDFISALLTDRAETSSPTSRSQRSQ